MRFKLVKIAVLLTTFPLMADTLNEAIHQALTTNPDVLFNRAKSLSTKQGVAIARGSFYPTIDVGAGAGRETSLNPTTAAIQGGSGRTTLNRTESNFELRQRLFAGGAVYNEMKRSHYVWQAQEWKTLGVAENSALDVVNRYLTVLMHEKLYSMAVQNYNRHIRVSKMINQLTESGLSRTSDVDQSNGRIAQAEVNKISAQANLREAKINYAKVVGKWPEKLVWPRVPPKQHLPSSLSRALQIGLNTHPLVKAAYMNVQEAKAQYKVSQASRFPKVDFILGGSKSRNVDGLIGPNEDTIGMVRVSYNLFRGGSDNARIRETAFQVQEAYEAKNGALIDLNESIRLSWNAYQSANLRLVPLKQHVASSGLTRSAYQEQFKLNKRTLLDLLDSETEQYQAQNDYVRGQVEEVFARYRILNGMGKLLCYLHMDLPVNLGNNNIFMDEDDHALLNTQDTHQTTFVNSSYKLTRVSQSSVNSEEKAATATVSDTGAAPVNTNVMTSNIAPIVFCKPNAGDDALRLLTKDAKSVQLLLDTCH